MTRAYLTTQLLHHVVGLVGLLGLPQAADAEVLLSVDIIPISPRMREELLVDHREGPMQVRMSANGNATWSDRIDQHPTPTTAVRGDHRCTGCS